MNLGFDLKFFSNRLGLDLTLYKIGGKKPDHECCDLRNTQDFLLKPLMPAGSIIKGLK